MEKYKDSSIHSHVRHIIRLLNIEEVPHKQEFKGDAAVSNHKRNNNSSKQRRNLAHYRTEL